jgi:hypothetical protein
VNATRAYATYTGRPITTKVGDWIRDLVEVHGDDAVAEAIEEHSLDTPADRLLAKVRDELVKAANRERARQAPMTILGPYEALAVARGERQPPTGPWAYETMRLDRESGEIVKLTTAEYDELIAWRINP